MAQRSHPRTNLAHHGPISASPAATALFADSRFAWLWLAARAWVGWLWLDAGRDKLGNARWMDGSALRDAWVAALATPDTHQPARWAIESLLGRGWEGWLAPTLAVGQTLVGIAVLLGLLTGLAAFVGLGLAAMPGMAGGAAVDPFVALLAVGLVLAWRCAGRIGLDRWVLPLVAERRAAQSPNRPERPVGQTPGADTSGLRNAPGRMSQ